MTNCLFTKRRHREGLRNGRKPVFFEGLPRIDASEKELRIGGKQHESTYSVVCIIFVSSEAVKSWHGRFFSCELDNTTVLFILLAHPPRSVAVGRLPVVVIAVCFYLSTLLWLRTRGCYVRTFDPCIHSTFRLEGTPVQVWPSFVRAPNCGSVFSSHPVVGAF